MFATRSPARIALSVIAVVTVCQIGLSLAMATIRTRTNEHAAAESVRIMSATLSQLAENLASVANDYNHWSEAFEALRSGDVGWMHENYGLSATNGEIFDGVVFFGGPLSEPWAWSAAHPSTEASPSFLNTDALDHIRGEVAKLPFGARQTYDTMTVIDGQLALISAGWLLPSGNVVLDGLDSADTGIAVLTETLEAPELAVLADTASFRELQFGKAPVPGWTRLEVRDHDGAPLGVLSWIPPRPGDNLLTGMLPVLAGLVAMNFALGAAVAWLAASRAYHLMTERELATTLARTDPLTRLPNRLAFTTHLERLERETVRQVAIIFIDVNGFKAVNDSLGHAAGDILIVEVAQRLASCRNDDVVLARLGGDEFTFVLSGFDGVTLEAEMLCRMVSGVMGEPFEIEGVPLHITLSLGLAVGQTADLPLKEILRRADVAMYRAKRDRLVDVQTYGPELEGESGRNREVEAALREALERPEQFDLFYQPIVTARGEDLTRAEALARWTSPTLGAVPPNVFIPIAERIGLMGSLGRLILDRVCADLNRCATLRVSLNVSPVQLRDPRFLTDLDAAIARHGADPARIEFELTEGVMIDQADRARQRLEALRDRGFSIALDDFGTGFSSIGYLTRMPFSTLKIDQVFLRRTDDLMRNLSLIRSIVHLAHTMDKKVVCEGVETRTQAAALTESGCDELQGYLFARPMSLAQLVAAYPEKLVLVA